MHGKWLFRVGALGLALALLGPVASARAATVESGAWKFVYDDASGFWRSLDYRDLPVCRNPDGKTAPFNWGPGWPGGPVRAHSVFRHLYDAWTPEWPVVQGPADYRFQGADWRPETATLRLAFRIGDWDAVDELVFGARNDPALFGRTLHLTYAPAAGGDQPALFANVAMNLPVTARGEYFFPGRRFPGAQEPARFEALGANQEVEGVGFLALPLLIEPKDGHTLILFPDPRKDRCGTQVARADGAGRAQYNFKAYGWAYPGETQTVGPAWLRVADKPLREAFRGGVWELYDAIGLRVPENRPEWTLDAEMFYFDVGKNGGLRASQFELAPRVAQLGFNTVWIQPVNDGPPLYNPRDFYKIHAPYGTAKDYRDLVGALHGAGARVLQDIVPHGGTPAFGQLRGNKPWMLTFDRNGDALGYWCFDYGHPEWREYMSKVAEFHTREYGLDGFRIDVPDGTHVPNWRRKDFPNLDKTPGNVPADWWRASLESVGGRLPPPTFERASVTRRESGLLMIRAIRDGMLRARPSGGAILGEVDPSPYMAEADLLYDMSICYFFIRELWPKTDPAAFSRAIAAWLDQSVWLEPRGTRRMRYVESHDSLPTRGFTGVGAEMAFTALTFLVDGMPMVYEESDIGKGVLVKNLIGLRRTFPELSRGTAAYRMVEPHVVVCARRLGEDVTFALVNLGPEPVETNLGTAAARCPPGRWSAWSGSERKRLFAGDAKGLAETGIRIGPWGWETISLRAENAPDPFPARPAPADALAPTPPKALTFDRNQWGSWVVAAPGYTLALRGDDGRLAYFNDTRGRRVLHGSGFLFDGSLGQESSAVPPRRPPSAEATDYGCRITTENALPGGGAAVMVYHCFDDRVEVEGRLEGEDASKRIGYLLMAEDAVRWQANTAEGLLDDLFAPRHQLAPPLDVPHRYTRTVRTPIVWQARTAPLDPARPELRVFGSHGGGAALGPADALADAPEDVMILDRHDNRSLWHAAFLWKIPENRFETSPVRRFRLRLAASAEPLPPPARYEPYRFGELTVRHDSRNWQVANRHFQLTLARQGGALRRLADARGMTLLRDADLRFTPKAGGTVYETAEDIETGARLWRNGERLHMRFTGAFRCPRKGHTAIYRPLYRFAVEYVFDETGGFDVDWRLLHDDGALPEKPSLWLGGDLPSSVTARWSVDGKSVAESPMRAAEAASVERPDRLTLTDRVGREQMSLAFDADASLPVRGVVDKAKLRLYWFENGNERIRPGEWTRTSARITVGGTAP